MDRITKAMQAIPRAGFLPPDVRPHSEFDEALPIGYGQTNSQPTTVRMMLEWLDPQPGEHVLDVGSGSGWTTALLAWLVGSRGSVHAVEKVPELVEFGAGNCERLGITNASFHSAGSSFGLPEYAPYHRILVSASADTLPHELPAQLRAGGRLVLPIKDSIHVISKGPDDALDDREHPGFVFVPLLG